MLNSWHPNTVMGESVSSVSSTFCSKVLRTSVNAGRCHAALGLVLFMSFTERALHVTQLLRPLFERHHYCFKNISAIFLIGSFILLKRKTCRQREGLGKDIR